MRWILRAFAKINLGLAVGPRDATGYHPLDTVFAQVGLFDRLTVERSQSWDLAVPGYEALADAPDNSVRAAQQLLAAQDPSWPRAWRIRLKKNIPLGAGLAGGSADAAAFLQFAQSQRPSLKGVLPALALKLGRDVPFCLTGGIARGEGYGERLTPFFAPGLSDWRVLLLNPGRPLATASVYRAFDRLAVPGAMADIAAVAAAIRAGQIPDRLDNGLEQAAFLVDGQLEAFKARLIALADGESCWLSGSGATYYMILNDPNRCQWLDRRMRANGVPYVKMTTFGPDDGEDGEGEKEGSDCRQ